MEDFVLGVFSLSGVLVAFAPGLAGFATARLVLNVYRHAVT
jgi:hypothetical protein